MFRKVVGGFLSKSASLMRAAMKIVEALIMGRFFFKDLPGAEKLFKPFGSLMIASSTGSIVGALMEGDTERAKIQSFGLIQTGLSTAAIFFLEGTAVAAVFTGAVVANQVVLFGVGIYKYSKGKLTKSDVVDIAINTLCNTSVTLLLTTDENWKLSIGKVFEYLRANKLPLNHATWAAEACVTAALSAVKPISDTLTSILVPHDQPDLRALRGGFDLDAGSNYVELPAAPVVNEDETVPIGSPARLQITLGS